MYNLVKVLNVNNTQFWEVKTEMIFQYMKLKNIYITIRSKADYTSTLMVAVNQHYKRKIASISL